MPALIEVECSDPDCDAGVTYAPMSWPMAVDEMRWELIAVATDAINLADFLRCYAPQYERRRFVREVEQLRALLNEVGRRPD